MKLTFHIQHNTTPKVLEILLKSCCDKRVTMAELAEEIDISVGTLKHIIPFVRQMGLLEAGRFSLTEKGKTFCRAVRVSSTTLPEGVHHLLYSLHHFDSSKRFSWAYSQVVDALWMSSTHALNSEMVAQLVGRVLEAAAQTFDVSVEQIAFSSKSVSGIFNWLRALDPPTVAKEGAKYIFRRRYFCPVSTFLWAVDFLYRLSRTAYGVRMFLTPKRIDSLCKICVLDPAGLGNVLMMAKRTTDFDRGGIFDYGTEGGFGRWILLARPCPVPSLPMEEQL